MTFHQMLKIEFGLFDLSREGLKRCGKVNFSI
jgi:hypothetical protein